MLLFTYDLEAYPRRDARPLLRLRGAGARAAAAHDGRAGRERCATSTPWPPRTPTATGRLPRSSARSPTAARPRAWSTASSADARGRAPRAGGRRRADDRDAPGGRRDRGAPSRRRRGGAWACRPLRPRPAGDATRSLFARGPGEAVWDLFAGDRRLGRDLGDLAAALVYPARRVAGLDVRPFFTPAGDLSVRVSPPRPPQARRTVSGRRPRSPLRRALELRLATAVQAVALAAAPALAAASATGARAACTSCSATPMGWAGRSAPP